MKIHISIIKVIFYFSLALFEIPIAYADNTKNQPLFDAINQSNIKAVEVAIESGADINAIGNDGLTPLMSAAIKKETDIVQVLLGRGANVNKSNKKGQTPLMAAVAGGDIDIVEALIAKGAKVDAATKDGKHAIDIARGQNKDGIVELLEKKSTSHTATNRTSKQSSVDTQGYTGPMVTMPAGEFMMGSPDSDSDADKDEKPQHQVTIKSFRLAQYSVTVEQFSRFVEEAGYDTGAQCKQMTFGGFKLAPGSFRSPGFAQGKLNPVVCISWDDARAYIEWLNKKTGQRFRLPTEAEREYATRAGSTTKYSFGDDASLFCRYGNGADQTTIAALNRDFNLSYESPFSCNDGAEYTTTVGRYLPNALGLYDMHGNVWEWMQDCFHESYMSASDDGGTWANGECGYRAVRGGSWSYFPAHLRSATRSRHTPDDRRSDLGFRLAQDR